MSEPQPPISEEEWGHTWEYWHERALEARAKIVRLEAERDEWKATANRIADKGMAEIERLKAEVRWLTAELNKWAPNYPTEPVLGT